MINTKDPRFRKYGMKCGIQLLRRSKVMSKRFLNDHPCIFHAARMSERFDNTDKKIRRNCQIMSGAGCRPERSLQAIKGRRLFLGAWDHAAPQSRTARR